MNARRQEAVAEALPGGLFGPPPGGRVLRCEIRRLRSPHTTCQDSPGPRRAQKASKASSS